MSARPFARLISLTVAPWQPLTGHSGCALQQSHFGGDSGVGLYVPARLATDFQVAAVPFRQQQVHQEVALPTILGLITDRADDFDVRAPNPESPQPSTP